MKLNKKGFMLAEVVIVASVITTVLVFLFISINRMSNAYDKRNRYYDIDAMYASMEINNILMRDNYIDEYIENDRDYISFLNNQESQGVDEYYDFYFNTGYDLVGVYYVKPSLESINKLNNSINNDNTYLKDYISYLKDNISFTNYKYLIIVELKKNDEDDIYFYTLKVKVGDTNETQS